MNFKKCKTHAQDINDVLYQSLKHSKCAFEFWIETVEIREVSIQILK